MKKAHRTRVTLVSKYRKNTVTLLAYPENQYGERAVSYESACRATRNMAGDYFPGLIIDRENKTAWLRRLNTF